MAADLQGQFRTVTSHMLLTDFPLQKALQLLEYLVKNGSERVVDDARSHIGTIKMLRNFYYVDEKGKDQGINGSFTASPCVSISKLSVVLSTQPIERTRRIVGRCRQNPL